MAAHNYEKCLDLVLEHEGGYVNHPRDPGGATNMGITLRTWESWTGSPATPDDIKALTVEDVKPVYKSRYWDRVSGPALPDGVDLMVFDFAVNSGVRRSAKYLQFAVGAKPDGMIGPMTLKAVDEYIDHYGNYRLIRNLRDMRVRFLRKLRTYDTFGRGWMRRVEKTTAFATALL